MSDDVEFALATEEDDAGIRRLLASNPVPGRIRIRYEREPNYFLGCATMGKTDVLVARTKDGRIVGVACRALRELFINGEPQTIGYLGQLRVDPQYRGRWLVARGFRKLHELHCANPAAGYFTTIIEGNHEAEGILVHHPRGAMPRYRRLDRLLTLALPVLGSDPGRRWQSASRTAGSDPALLRGRMLGRMLGSDPNFGMAVAGSGPSISPTVGPLLRGQASPTCARSAPLSGSDPSGEGQTPRRFREAVAFLRREGAKKNFFPVYDEGSFSGDTTRGFDRDDLIVVEHDGAIVGVAGLWDQSSYKQSIVDAYDPLTRMLRPVYNLASKALRRSTLPKPEASLCFAYGSFFCVASDDPSIARTLINMLLARARAKGLDHLLLGFAESDPMLAVVRSFRHLAYPAAIYAVAWDGDDFHERLDARPRSLEIASL